MGSSTNFSPDCSGMRFDSPTFLNCPPNYLHVLSESCSLVSPALVHGQYRDRPCSTISRVHAGLRLGAFQDSPLARQVFDKSGVRDQVLIVARDSVSSGCARGGLRTNCIFASPNQPAPGSRRTAHRVAAHRLRRAFGTERSAGSSRDADAVLSDSGKLLHADGEAGDKRSRDVLSAAAQKLLESRARFRTSDPDRVLQIWNALIDGRWSR